MKSIYTKKIEEENYIQFLPLVNLSDRDKEIVKKYVLDQMSYNAIGKEYGISGERVRQIIEKFARKSEQKRRHLLKTQNQTE